MRYFKCTVIWPSFKGKLLLAYLAYGLEDFYSTSLETIFTPQQQINRIHGNIVIQAVSVNFLKRKRFH